LESRFFRMMVLLTIQTWRWHEKVNVFLFPYLVVSFVLFTSLFFIFLPSFISFFLILFIFLLVSRFYLALAISYPLSFFYVCPQALPSLPLFSFFSHLMVWDGYIGQSDLKETRQKWQHLFA
jgi:hypothetical protein